MKIDSTDFCEREAKRCAKTFTQTRRIARCTALRLSGRRIALYGRLGPRFSSLTVMETERKNRAKTLSGQ